MKRTVGILGFGYLGKELQYMLGAHVNLWVSQQRLSDNTKKLDDQINAVTFQWDNPASWTNLPEDDSTLIITIPPLSDDVSSEHKRLQKWCKWVRTNRPDFRRCIYISSTGVYPNSPGDWSERSQFTCDSVKGQLRLNSERTLSEHFETTVVRPGAIYGNSRNIGKRILSGKPIPKGDQPVHRIHVHDLARLVAQAVQLPQFPKLLNAVDMERETTRNVATWLMEQPFFPKTDEMSIQYKSDFQTRKFLLNQPDRKISNQKLVEDYGFTFIYPTYKEGLAQAFQNPPTQRQ